jgi:hypothetical protein
MVLAPSLLLVLAQTQSRLDASKLVEPRSSGVAQATIQRAFQLADWTSAVRRELHRCPELLYSLHETSERVRARLDELRIPYVFPVADTGIVATIGTWKPPCVGLRADMDALPIPEVSELPTGCRWCSAPECTIALTLALAGASQEIESTFKSQTAGQMHACGHDAHTAMLLTAARILKEREAELSGTVKLIFQPAEEVRRPPPGALLARAARKPRRSSVPPRRVGQEACPWCRRGCWTASPRSSACSHCTVSACASPVPPSVRRPDLRDRPRALLPLQFGQDCLRAQSRLGPGRSWPPPDSTTPGWSATGGTPPCLTQ